MVFSFVSPFVSSPSQNQSEPDSLEHRSGRAVHVELAVGVLEGRSNVFRGHSKLGPARRIGAAAREQAQHFGFAFGQASVAFHNTLHLLLFLFVVRPFKNRASGLPSARRAPPRTQGKATVQSQRSFL